LRPLPFLGVALLVVRNIFLFLIDELLRIGRPTDFSQTATGAQIGIEGRSVNVFG
jgi:hypothetical protein